MTAVLFKTHKWEEVDQYRFHKLCDDLKDWKDWKVYCLYDNTNGDAPDIPNILTYNAGQLYGLVKDVDYYVRPNHEQYTDKEKSIRLNSVSMLLFEKEIDADHYWYIENDAFFYGDWKDFFKAFETSKSHLIATYVHLDNNSKRRVVNSISRKGVFKDIQNVYTCLMAVSRMSRELVKSLVSGYRKGMIGHFEAVIPTRCVQEFGEEALEDISLGKHCKPQNQGRFYNGLYVDIGTFGWMRVSDKIYPDKLYHPFKELSDWEKSNR